MSNIVLDAKPRKTEEKISLIREANDLPAVVYGPKSDNQAIAVNAKEFAKAYAAAGDSTLIDLKINEGEPVKVLVHETQQNPRNGEIIHVDLYQIDMSKKIKVDVALIINNIEQIEKATGGETIHGLQALPVECLPKDLIKEIEIDASEYLHELGDVMHASKVKLPEGLELTGDPSSPIVSIQELRKKTEAEEKMTEEPKEDKKEEEDKSEGDKADGDKTEGEDEKEGEEEKKS